MKWIRMQETYICPNCGHVSTTQPQRCPSCAGYLSTWDNKPSIEEAKWVLKITYATGLKETKAFFRDLPEAIESMRKHAFEKMLSIPFSSLSHPDDALGRPNISCLEIKYYDEGFPVKILFTVEEVQNEVSGHTN